MTVALVVEGDTDIPYARQLAVDAGLEIWTEIDCGGKDQLDINLPSYNDAAKGSPWFVLRDLDHDGQCPGTFIKSLDMSLSSWMCFRLAVREVESWVLADVQGVEKFFSVRANAIPSDPDSEADPTRTLVNLARASRSSRIKKAMVPRRGTSVSVGPLYESLLIQFGEKEWSLERAAQNSPSLRKARQRLRELSTRWFASASPGSL